MRQYISASNIIGTEAKFEVEDKNTNLTKFVIGQCIGSIQKETDKAVQIKVAFENYITKDIYRYIWLPKSMVFELNGYFFTEKWLFKKKLDEVFAVLNPVFKGYRIILEEPKE